MNYYTQNNELYHYGVIGMHWGVRRYQPYPADSKKGREIGEAAKAKRAAGLQKHYTKAVNKLNKIDKKRVKAQEKANAQFVKAEKKAASTFFYNPEKVKTYSERAARAQTKANALTRKGEQWYRSMEKAFAKTGLQFDPEVTAMGQNYISMMRAHSNSMFNQAFVELELAHSAKGSTWEEHKYIKRVDGTYYYPDSYEGGRHISDLEGKSSDSSDSSSKEREKMDLADDDIEKLALEVTRGNFGNGEMRKELLGPNYEEIQARVNQMYREGKVSGAGVQISSVSEPSVSEGKAAAEAAAKAATTVQSKGGINLDQIYSVYAARDAKKEEVSKGKRYEIPEAPKRLNKK